MINPVNADSLKNSCFIMCVFVHMLNMLLLIMIRTELSNPERDETVDVMSYSNWPNRASFQKKNFRKNSEPANYRQKMLMCQPSQISKRNNLITNHLTQVLKNTNNPSHQHEHTPCSTTYQLQLCFRSDDQPHLPDLKTRFSKNLSPRERAPVTEKLKGERIWTSACGLRWANPGM